ncbi:MAG: hypothetical protein N2C14_12260, partial [Planctomycetales bacterium]
SDRLSQRKFDNIRETGASILLSPNAGCYLQIAKEARRQGHPIWIAHPMDLLDMSYRGEQPPLPVLYSQEKS